MPKEKLFVKVDSELGKISLEDDYGMIGDVELSEANPEKRIIQPGKIDPKIVSAHKVICLGYNFFPNAKVAKEPEHYKELIETPVDVPSIDWGEIDNSARMTYALDKYRLDDFINELGAEKRVDIQEGQNGQYWMLNLRVSNPSEVHITSLLR